MADDHNISPDELAALEALDQRLPREHLPPPDAGNRAFRVAFHTARKKPEILRELTPKMRVLCEYIVFGAPAWIADRHGKRPGEALTLDEAAYSLRFRLRNAREISRSEVFRREYARQLQGLREGMHVDAINAVHEILVDKADETAATKTVRLKAASMVLGEEAKRGTQVNVNINNGIQSLTAGIVVRLPSTAKSTPSENAKVVEGIELQSEPDHQFISADDGQQRLKRVTE